MIAKCFVMLQKKIIRGLDWNEAQVLSNTYDLPAIEMFVSF